MQSRFLWTTYLPGTVEKIEWYVSQHGTAVPEGFRALKSNIFFFFGKTLDQIFPKPPGGCSVLATFASLEKSSARKTIAPPRELKTPLYGTRPCERIRLRPSLDNMFDGVNTSIARSTYGLCSFLGFVYASYYRFESNEFATYQVYTIKGECGTVYVDDDQVKVLGLGSKFRVALRWSLRRFSLCTTPVFGTLEEKIKFRKKSDGF